MTGFYTQGCDYKPAAKRKLSAWVRDTAACEGYAVGDISFVFCSPEYHLEVNRAYLGHDYNTDVITFDYSDLQNERVISGDILIDPSTVRSQAPRWGATESEEMLRVMIHGVLHLCGYGDKSPEEEAVMRGRENHYLKRWHDIFESPGQQETP